MRKTKSYYVNMINGCKTLPQMLDVIQQSKNGFYGFSGDTIVNAFLQRYSVLFPHSKVDVDKSQIKLIKRYRTLYLTNFGPTFNTRNFVPVADENSSKRWLTATDGYTMIRLPSAFHTGMYCLVNDELFKYSDESIQFLYPVPSQYNHVGLVSDLQFDNGYYHKDSIGVHKSAIPSKKWHVFVHNHVPLAPVVISETNENGKINYNQIRLHVYCSSVNYFNLQYTINFICY